MKKKKEEAKELTAPFWMATFSDMVTLLLVFFILILSFSVIELEKFKGAMSSMKGALGVLPEYQSVIQKSETNPYDEQRDLNFEYGVEEKLEKVQEFERMIKTEGLGDLIEVGITETGIDVRLGDRLLFDVGKAELKPEAFKVLKGIASLLDDDFETLYVEGHTDNVPIRTKQFPSNWELSTARALKVLKYFYRVEHVDAKKLAAVGHGEHRPIVPNDSHKNRAKNRRVEISIKW
jgi:chemotaxis protein MotB